MDILKEDLLQCLLSYTSYILVDHAKIKEFIEMENEVQQFKTGSNKARRNPITYPIDIFAIMVVEKSIDCHGENVHSYIIFV